MVQAGRPHYKGPIALVVAGFQPAILAYLDMMSLEAREPGDRVEEGMSFYSEAGPKGSVYSNIG